MDLNAAFDAAAYVRQFDPRARLVGYDLEIACPDCGKKKFYVTVKTKTIGGEEKPPGTWCCFYCGDGGIGAVSLVARLEEISRGEAFRFLMQGQYLTERAKATDLKQVVADAFTSVLEPAIVEPLPEIQLPASFRFLEDMPRETWHPYIRSRGISMAAAQRYGLGVTGRDPVSQYRNRLVAPILAPNGGPLVSFQGRWLAKTPPEGTKKSIYPAKTTEGTVIGRCLYGYDEAKSCRRLILVEDVWSRIRLGRSALGTYGTSLTRAQLDLLLATSAEEIVFMWDRDTTVRHKPTRCVGRCPHCRRYEKAQSLIHKLAEFWTVRPVILPDDRDPDEHPVSALQQMIEAAPVLNQNDTFKRLVQARLE